MRGRLARMPYSNPATSPPARLANAGMMLFAEYGTNRSCYRPAKSVRGG